MPDVDAILDELLDALSAQSIICEPIEMDDKFIIPITKMGMGFGTNINMGQRGLDASHESLAKCSAGGGVGFFPVAVVVVFKGISGPEGVKVVPLSPPGESASSIAY
ncbi:MAG: spore germination protein GerW family protein, partial [Methanothrix sp.]